MAIVTLYQRASGSSFDDCGFLGLRYDDARGWHQGESEWWVMSARRAAPGRTTVRNQYGAARWYTGLWRSARRVAYVCDAAGEVHVNPDLDAAGAHGAWARYRLGAPLFGIWGLDDSFVLAWGATFDDRFPVFRWDGARWIELPSPGFHVECMHGTAPDRVWAGGKMGMLARWDGRAWHRLASPVNEHVVSMFVVSPDEQYATGHRGSLLEGSASGWGVIARNPAAGMPLYAVARWKGELWVGGGQLGLFRRVGRTSTLEPFKPNLQATALDAREDLVVTCFDFIASTSDGQKFMGAGDDALLTARAGKDLRDFS